MAIYSLHHSHVGRRTQAQPGTAGAHVRYITRAGAARLVMGEHMPTGRDQARAWIDEQEMTGRKDGRVIDKLMVALPRELDGQQRAELVREFVAAIGGGRVSWLAAVHDRGEDEHNPHAHIILRDKDHETGKRVFGTSGRGSTDRLREIWETVANRVLEREGQEARIDRRSLADQALAREPGIHVGPNVLAMEERGLRPESLAQDHTTSRGNERVIDWPTIDQGRTRADRQREIEAMNRDREAARGKEKGDQQAELAPAQPEAELPRPKPLELGPDVAAILRGLDDRARDITGLISTPQPERVEQLDPLAERRAWAERLRGLDQAEQTAQRDPVADRQAWAERLRGFEAAPERAPEPQREAQAQAWGRERTDVAGQEREATQRPSYEAPGPEKSAAQEIEAERSRLARIIEAGRERLAAVADRLEQAFQAFRDRQQIRVADQQPEQASAAERDPWAEILTGGRKPWQPAPEKPQEQEREDRGRSMFPDYSRGRERKGPGF